MILTVYGLGLIATVLVFVVLARAIQRNRTNPRRVFARADRNGLGTTVPISYAAALEIAQVYPPGHPNYRDHQEPPIGTAGDTSPEITEGVLLPNINPHNIYALMYYGRLPYDD